MISVILCVASAASAQLPSVVSAFISKAERVVDGKLPSAPPRFTTVIFLSPVCPCSRFHEPALGELPGKFPDVQFIGVYAGRDAVSEAEARTHFSKATLGFPVLRDAQFQLANALEAHRTPHAFVFDDKGGILYQGAVDDARTSKPNRRYLEETLTLLKNGKALEVTSTRPMGCRIER